MAEYLKIMDGYFCGKAKRAAELKQACDDAKSAYETQKTQCNEKQAAFESSFCQWRTRVSDTCTELDTCYDSAVKAYRKRNEATQALVRQWEVEHASLHKILCYTKVWLSESKDHNATAQYNECDALKPDTSAMRIKELAVPEKQTCDLTSTQNYPGTTGFFAEYSAFPKFVRNVTACVETTSSQGPTPAPKPEGTGGASLLRLSGGSADEGRLEVLYNDVWGTVCNHQFDHNDALVACRHLGFSSGFKSSNQFGPGTGNIWLDDLQCAGSERTLHECTIPKGWGSHDCQHSEDVSIKCQ
jgi:hypothetical protein